MKIKGIILIILALLAVFFIYVFLLHQQEEQLNQVITKLERTNYSEFVNDLATSDKVYIISDLRNTNDSLRNPIMQCGIDLAGSVALAPKNITYFAMEGNTCISSSSNKSISDCERMSRTGVTFLIRQGLSTEFYRNLIIIGIYNSTPQCAVVQKIVR